MIESVPPAARPSSVISFQSFGLGIKLGRIPLASERACLRRLFDGQLPYLPVSLLTTRGATIMLVNWRDTTGRMPTHTGQTTSGRPFAVVAVLIPQPMVIVVDTSVFVSACLETGAASEVVGCCLRGEHEPLMGVALLAEYGDVLGRNALFRTCRLSAEERDELLDIFIAHCRWTVSAQPYHVANGFSA